MSNTHAIIRFCVSCVCCASLLVYTSLEGLFALNSDTITTYSEQAVTQTSIQTPNPQTDNTLSEQLPPPQETVSQDTASVAVSATGTVQGAVIEKFISPYTANTSYNNVYLKNNTGLTLNLKEFVESELGFKLQKNTEPQVLILHTHATESYILHGENHYTDTDNTRTTDNQYNMVALGKIVADKLNEAGIITIHDETQHDYPSYNQSYKRAAKTINSYIQKHPSIKIVIDLHRDAIAANDTDKVKVTTEIDGKKAAQIMLVMGSQNSDETNFPNWRENLKLATKIQQTVEVMYPSLARSIHFTSSTYNQSLTTGSVLIEIGTDGNTLDEAKYSAELLSNALISLFNTL